MNQSYQLNIRWYYCQKNDLRPYRDYKLIIVLPDYILLTAVRCFL